MTSEVGPPYHTARITWPLPVMLHTAAVCTSHMLGYVALHEMVWAALNRGLHCAQWHPGGAPTNSTEQNHSLDADSPSANLGIPWLLFNPEYHHPVHKSLPLVPILSQINPVHTILSYLRSVLILFPHLRLGLPIGLFPYGFSTNILYAFLFSPIRVTFPTTLILLELIIPIILGEQYNGSDDGIWDPTE
jgi:hypothetical protein